MKPSRSVSLVFVFLACAAGAFSVEGQLHILSRELVPSWDYPITQAQDVQRVLPSATVDAAGEARRRGLPTRDRGLCHALEPRDVAPVACRDARLTRAPPRS